MPNVTCNICNASFPSSSKCDAHRKRVCQETGTVVDSLGLVIRQTQQNGKFHCHCSNHPSSPKEFSTIDGLQKHLHKVKAPWITPEDTAIPPTEAVRGKIAMESLSIQGQQQQGQELCPRWREGSYPLKLSSDIDGKGKGKVVEGLQEEEESEEDGYDRGTGQAVQGQQKVQGSSLSLYSSISVSMRERKESEAGEHDMGECQVAEDLQEELEYYPTHFSPIAMNFGQEHDESPHESDEDEDGEDSEDEEIGGRRRRRRRRENRNMRHRQRSPLLA
ncbi:hypothetical protein F5141DRAFT_1068646 [Pisolithus sp. B1]|nr:hypothetical protein F5141DRAFT_1068646 [Pisolithus sp. B1]